MASRFAPWALIFLLPYNVIIFVDAVTSARFYTDLTCRSLFATVSTAANVGNGQCGTFPLGIGSASAVALDEGCYVTIYTDDCSDGATAVRLDSCTVLDAKAFSIDCPGINGTSDPGYTTSTAEGISGTRLGVESTAAPLVSTTGSEQEQSLPTISTTLNPEPYPVQTPSSSPTPSESALTQFTVTRILPESTTSSSPSPSSTTRSLTSNSTTSSLSSQGRNPQSSLQPPSSSSPASSANGHQTSGNHLDRPTTIILAVVFAVVGALAAFTFVILWTRRMSAAKKQREMSEKTESPPPSDPAPFLQPKPELEATQGRKNELDATTITHEDSHELGSVERYEIGHGNKGGRAEMMGVRRYVGIHELGGDEHCGELEGPRIVHVERKGRR